MSLLMMYGCAAGDLDADEAALVFDAMSTVNGDTWARIYDRSAPELDAGTDTGGGLDKGLLFHTDFTDGTFEGTVEGPGSWTGSVSVDGRFGLESLGTDNWSQIWAMSIGWEKVRWGGLRVDGAFDWDVKAEIEDESTFTYLSRVRGEVTARGDANGTAEVDYLTTAVLGGGRYQVVVTGTVGGHDVSTAWDATDAFGL